MANDICNRAGLDTISSSTIIGFAIELYENGILTKEDTEGIDLKWGDAEAASALLKRNSVCMIRNFLEAAAFPP